MSNPTAVQIPILCGMAMTIDHNQQGDTYVCPKNSKFLFAPLFHQKETTKKKIIYALANFCDHSIFSNFESDQIKIYDSYKPISINRIKL